MLAGISYESALDKVYKDGRVDYTEICDLKRALVSLGLKTAYRTVKIEKNNLENLAGEDGSGCAAGRALESGPAGPAACNRAMSAAEFHCRSDANLR
jgi:hypothetical protein